jgi:hypothetical protein
MSVTIFSPNKILIGIDDISINNIDNANIIIKKNKLIIQKKDLSINIEFELLGTEFNFIPDEVISHYIFQFNCNQTSKCQITYLPEKITKKFASNILIHFSDINDTILFFKNLLLNVDNLTDKHIFCNDDLTFNQKIYYYLKYIEIERHNKNSPFYRSPPKPIKYCLSKYFSSIITDVYNKYIEFNSIDTIKNDLLHIQKILDLLIEKRRDFEAIIQSKLDNSTIVSINFDNPFVIIISPIFLQGLCPKLAIVKKDLANKLIKFVSKFASYDLFYDMNTSEKTEILSDMNLCIRTIKPCTLFETMMDFLSIFFKPETIETFKTNTNKKISDSSLIGSSATELSSLPIVSSSAPITSTIRTIPSTTIPSTTIPSTTISKLPFITMSLVPLVPTISDLLTEI